MRQRDGGKSRTYRSPTQLPRHLTVRGNLFEVAMSEAQRRASADKRARPMEIINNDLSVIIGSLERMLTGNEIDECVADLYLKYLDSLREARMTGVCCAQEARRIPAS